MVKEIKNNKSKAILIIGVIICFLTVVFGIILLITHKEYEENIREVDSVSLNAYFKKDNVITSDNRESNKIINYMAVIEIPKINLKQGIPYTNNKDSNVDRNIVVIDGSVTPDIENGAFILAAHSGNSYISYFKNLYKLKMGSYVYIYYKNVKYIYTISEISNIEKNGNLTIKRDVTKNTLMLVTCTKNSKSKQTVYTAYLKEKKGE